MSSYDNKIITGKALETVLDELIINSLNESDLENIVSVPEITAAFYGIVDTDEVDEYGTPIQTTSSTRYATVSNNGEDYIVTPDIKSSGYALRSYATRSNGRGFTFTRLNNKILVRDIIENCTLDEDGYYKIYPYWTQRRGYIARGHYKLYTNEQEALCTQTNSSILDFSAPVSSTWISALNTAAKKTGWTLLGWYTEPTGGMKLVIGSSGTKINNLLGANDVGSYIIDIYAHYSKAAKFYKDTTTTSANLISTIDVTTDDSYILTFPACEEVKEGYTFVGWKTDSSETIYQPEQTLDIRPLVQGQSTTYINFIAQWTEV